MTGLRSRIELGLRLCDCHEGHTMIIWDFPHACITPNYRSGLSMSYTTTFFFLIHGVPLTVSLG